MIITTETCFQFPGRGEILNQLRHEQPIGLTKNQAIVLANRLSQGIYTEEQVEDMVDFVLTKVKNVHQIHDIAYCCTRVATEIVRQNLVFDQLYAKL